jgi:uncharacterized membrane protein
MKRKLRPLFGILCHQLDDRTHTVCNEKLFVCARCLGVYFGFIYSLAILLLMYGIFWAEIKLYLVLLLIAPMAYDGMTQAFRLRKSNNRLRLVTGYLAGAGTAYLFYGALSMAVFPDTAVYMLPTIPSLIILSGLPLLWYVVEKKSDSNFVGYFLDYSVLVSTLVMFSLFTYLWFEILKSKVYL